MHKIRLELQEYFKKCLNNLSFFNFKKDLILKIKTTFDELVVLLTVKINII